MVRAIKWITEVPREEDTHARLLDPFAIIARLAIMYAPDRMSRGAFQRSLQELRQHFTHSQELVEALEQSFITELYADRRVRHRIRDMIPAKRLILLHGLVGVGKTVVLKKLEHDYKTEGPIAFTYFDLKAMPGFDYVKSPREISERFERHVYSRLYEDYVHPSQEMIDQWTAYKITHDDSFMEFREWVEQYERRPLTADSDWSEALSKDIVKDRLDKMEAVAHYSTLVKFVREHVKLLLCFDNVDRHPVATQRVVFSKCIHMSNEAEIPVILAIRERNLRRIMEEGAKGDPVLVDFLERLSRGAEDTILLEDIQEATVQDLLDRRLDFVKGHDSFGTLDTFLEALAIEEPGLDFEEYRKRFWESYESISTEFVDHDVHRYANYNIRSILEFYFRFITKVLVNPEREYSAAKLMIRGKKARRTQLRNYFYKWLVCADSPVPSNRSSLPNIYGELTPHLRLISIRVLECLVNWDLANPDSKVTFGEMATVFTRFGVKAVALERCLGRLSGGRGDSEMGQVLVDRAKGSRLSDDTSIEILPAGDYFLNVASISREYAFWNALLADIEFDLIGEPCPLSRTYDDRFKLEIVYEFADRVLVPALLEELLHYRKNLDTPKGWRRPKEEYLRIHFSIDGHYYVERLLRSVWKTIQYSHLASDVRKELDKKYLQLIEAVEEAEGLHSSGVASINGAG
jgi:hypothetical protein